MIKNILIVGIGGGAGSIARYLCQKWINESYQHSFPLSTFLVNLTGCFLIGFLYGMGERNSIMSHQIRLLLMTGFCGGYTTFSAFALENFNLLRAGQNWIFLLYALGSVALGIVAVFIGTILTKQM